MSPSLETPKDQDRTLMVWCPDWPLVAAGLSPGVPAVVLEKNKVFACSASARVHGVRIAQKLREAQSICPDVITVDHDLMRDMRAFEPIVAAVAELSPRVEVVRPGLCATPTRGASRYFGGDAGLIAVVREMLKAMGVEAAIGIANGHFAAALAARNAGVNGNNIIEDGGTPVFLSSRPIVDLARPELTELLSRLGIRTLGDFAALDGADVAARFGPQGTAAHQLAAGRGQQLLRTHELPQDFVVSVELEPPATLSDQVAFAGKALADELLERLAGSNFVCTLVAVEAETEHGENRRRLWRHDLAFTSSALVDRIRWQIDGWLTATDEAPSSAVVHLLLEAVEVVPDTGRQFQLWGGETEADQRAARALARVQAMLGFGEVVTAVVRGGRGPGDGQHFVAWGEHPEPAGETGPWPGALPSPSPSLLHEQQRTLSILGDSAVPVIVTKRGLLNIDPRRVAVAGGRYMRVAQWSAPWLFDEQWWDPDGRTRKARMQMITEDGVALLAMFERSEWKWEATYD